MTAQLLVAIIAVCGTLSALIGLATALIGFTLHLQGRKIDEAKKQNDALQAQVAEVHVIVNSNFAKVQSDLRTAVERIIQLTLLQEQATEASGVGDKPSRGELAAAVASMQVAVAAVPAPSAALQEIVTAAVAASSGSGVALVPLIVASAPPPPPAPPEAPPGMDPPAPVS